MTPFQKQEQIKAQIYGSYNNVTPIKKSEEEKPLEEETKNEETTEENKEEETKEGE